MALVFNDRPTVPEWEKFGVAIRAASRIPCVSRFMDALKSGEITARVSDNPSEAGKAAIANAGSLAPAWWVDHEDNAEERPRGSDQWMQCDVEVQHGPTLRLIFNYLEERRQHYGSQFLRRSRKADEWNHVDALAWFATENIEVLETLRDFAPETYNNNDVIAARRHGLQYLFFQLTWDDCQCGSVRPLLSIDASGGCQCLKRAWDDLLATLKRRNPPALFVGDTGTSKSLLPPDYLKATLDLENSRFKLVHESGELLFDARDVQSAKRTGGSESILSADRSSTSSSGKREAKGPGRPLGSGAIDDTTHLDTMHEWLKGNPGKTPRDAALCVEPQASRERAALPESVIRRLVGKY